MRNSRGQPLIVPLSAFLTEAWSRGKHGGDKWGQPWESPREEEDEGEWRRARLHAEDKPGPRRRADCKDKKETFSGGREALTKRSGDGLTASLQPPLDGAFGAACRRGMQLRVRPVISPARTAMCCARGGRKSQQIQRPLTRLRPAPPTRVWKPLQG